VRRARANERRDRWDEALQWHAMLREEAGTTALGEEADKAWRQWIGDPQNRRTLAAVRELLADPSAYGHPRRPTPAELEQDTYDLDVPISQWSASQSPEAGNPKRDARRWWPLTARAAIVAAAILVVLLLMPPSDTAGAGPISFRTTIGEVREVPLRDGSSIVLGGDTALSVVFSSRQRSVRLLQGQAWFRVAHDRRWPFVVAAAQGTITAVGTAFVVTRDASRVRVTVTEGTVELAARSAPAAPQAAPHATRAPLRVTHGEEAVLSDNGRLLSERAADLTAATAWMRGRLIFDDQPLREVVETINRYSSVHLKVSPAAGALRFSGVVLESEVDDWLQSLQAIYPISVQRSGAAVRIELRGPLHGGS